ncbi:DUF5119 domain-containing protein [Butyricimonas sp.]|uniref:DUF5119 domain-containing protein n=1 Tax=Butyricimonas sp. TaxID=1969738 RepID=UPI0025C4A368|nr:DUF5119 domain-containing protein [Butyricimonas sp.]
MKRINTRVTVFLAAVLLLAGGCHRRPLEDASNSTALRVAVNIKAIMNVTCDIYNEKIPVPAIEPEMMRVLFYDPVSKAIAAETYISDITYAEDGTRCLEGDISVRPGTYEMLIYNFDTESTMIRNDGRFATIEAYTDRVAASIQSNFGGRADEESYMVYEPDHLVVARSERETIPFHEGLHVVKTDAESIVETYYLQIKVDGLQYVSSARAVLTGMVPSNRFGLNECATSPPATLYFTLRKSDDKGVDVLATVFNTFGRIDKRTNNLSVTFDIRTTDGRVVKRDFDITPLFSSEDCVKRHWLLLEETIKIDPPASAGGGFDPTVDDWEDEHHDIEL